MSPLDVAMTKKHQFISKKMLTVLAEKGIKQGFDTEFGGIGSFINNPVRAFAFYVRIKALI